MPSWFSGSRGGDSQEGTLDPSLQEVTTKNGTQPTGYLLSYVSNGSFLNADSVVISFDAVLSPEASSNMTEDEIKQLSRTAIKLENLLSRKISYLVMTRYADLKNDSILREVEAASRERYEFADELLSRSEYSGGAHVSYNSKRAMRKAAKTTRTPSTVQPSVCEEVFGEIDEEVGAGITREEIAREIVKKAEEARNQR
ncbi:hypothetical protein L202_08200 [Cryptococcus amylolentus CBS 6039]|uniref:Uncharacterized protein n=1 Tax=Cryptococcus amylolentus CBS 6039 TaxID=1295533 RepID=A0A1E3H9F4_9TREE|nr:hypothetical protein L202_08200 [Cryptococcus amylolentus CBS 6039]ODN72765.1 hypothetical protein L202_08200 [Cryptococcus amylolentus CBS 6039]